MFSGEPVSQTVILFPYIHIFYPTYWLILLVVIDLLLLAFIINDILLKCHSISQTPDIVQDIVQAATAGLLS